MRPLPLAPVLLIGAVFLPGCSAPTHNYAAVTPQLDAAGRGRVVVATHDRRPYVVSADKSLSFAGVTRTAVGTPVNINTSSDRPLAEDWTQAVCRGLRRRGFEPVAVPVGPRDTSAVILQRLRSAGGKAALLFTLRDWQSDSYVNTSLEYDAGLEVIDPAGEVIARSFVRGRDELGAGSIDTSEYARRVVLDSFQKKVQQMLNDPAVVRALR